MIEVGQIEDGRPEWLTLTDALLVAVRVNDILSSVIGLIDPLRAESKEMVRQLRAMGVKRVLLVTGDRKESAAEVAQAVGITGVYSSVVARGKMELVEQCMSDTRGIVVVVGHGANTAH